MSFPGLPGGTSGGGRDVTAGMSDQEAAMVKAVSRSLHDVHSREAPDGLLTVDARSHGKLCFQDRYFGRDGLCSWRRFRVVHVKRTCRRSGGVRLDIM